MALSQRATDTANSISTLASHQIATAKILSDRILSELQKVQESITQLPQTLQATYPDVSKSITDLRDVITNNDLPVTDKVNRLAKEVKERVSPMLEKLTQKIGEHINVLGSKKEEAKSAAQANANGPSSASTR